MIAETNKKELLLATTIIITGLSIVTIRAVILPSTDNTITQVLGQKSATSNNDNSNTTTTHSAGSALYNLTTNQ